jgi:O-antigen/teichoic acid export membrane protein
MLKLKKDTFLRNVSILFLGALGSQLINIVGLPILSRMYGIPEFATLALFLATGSIVLSFSTLQLDYAIVKSETLEEKLVLIKITFFSIFSIAILSCFGLLICSKFHPKIDSIFIITIFIFLIVSAGNQVLFFFFNSERKYVYIATARILLISFNVIIAVLLFFSRPNIGLILSITSANLISFTFLLYFFRKNIKKVFQMSTSFTSDVLRQNIQFLKFSTPASLLDILSKEIIIIFLATYFSEHITASFFMAMKVILLPTGLIGGAIGNVFYKDISGKFSRKTLSFIDFWKIWRALFLLGIIPFVILILYGQEIFVFVLGEEWILAGEMGAILAISGFFTFLNSPTSSGFIVLNKQKYNLFNAIIRISYTIIFLILGVWKNDFFLFLWCYVIAELAKMVLYNLVMMYSLNKAKNDL